MMDRLKGLSTSCYLLIPHSLYLFSRSVMTAFFFVLISLHLSILTFTPPSLSLTLLYEPKRWSQPNLYHERCLAEPGWSHTYSKTCSCGSVVERCVSSAKVMGSIPREHMYWQNMYNLKSLWINVSVKYKSRQFIYYFILLNNSRPHDSCYTSKSYISTDWWITNDLWSQITSEISLHLQKKLEAIRS